MEPILFMFCLTLHNIEEALWFHDWQVKTVKRKQRTLQKTHFTFAVLGVTVLGYLAAGLYLLFPDKIFLEYIFLGIVGAMLFNAVMPHLLLTIAYRKYCPGVLTGCTLLIPFHSIILFNALNRSMAFIEVLIPTIIVGAVLLGSIVLFEKLAIKIFGAEG